jgi:hypothetical protein
VASAVLAEFGFEEIGGAVDKDIEVLVIPWRRVR